MAAPTVNNVQSNTLDGSTSLTISSYVTPAGSDQVLVLCVAIENQTADGLSTAPTFDGNAMTLAKLQTEPTPPSSFTDLAYIYYYDAPSGTGDIAMSFTSTSDAGAVAFTLNNAASGGPEATDGASDTDTDVLASITTVSNDALVVDALSSGEQSVCTTTETGQTSQADGAVGGQMYYGASTKEVASAGAATMGWEYTGTSRRLALAVAAWATTDAGSGQTDVNFQGTGRGILRGVGRGIG